MFAGIQACHDADMHARTPLTQVTRLAAQAALEPAPALLNLKLPKLGHHRFYLVVASFNEATVTTDGTLPMPDAIRVWQCADLKKRVQVMQHTCYCCNTYQARPPPAMKRGT
jgi:hypothetical protein